MRRILDLGCGTGDSWRNFGLPENPAAQSRAQEEDFQIIGFDIAHDRLLAARRKYADRGWRFACARGESIPLADASVHGAISQVAMPYMHIPKTLAELHRVLVPGGWLKATLHPPSFTWEEFRRSFPRPQASLFRAFVFLNGMVLHFSGRVLSLGQVAESCQTERGIKIVLRRAGFTEVNFRREGRRFLVEAKRQE